MAELIEANQDYLEMGGRKFHSRLFIGTGKFSSSVEMRDAISSSETEIVTVALRRVNLENTEDDILSSIDRSKILLLPNTSGARSAIEAVRLAKLARSLGAGDWVKLEVVPDPVYLLPDPIESLKAAIELVKDGFKVMPYVNADPVLCKHLEELKNKPIVYYKELGEPSHAAEAMEMGADAVLVNTAIAIAKNPARIAEAFKLATIAGRLSYLHRGRRIQGNLSIKANASSPLTGFLNEEDRVS